MKVEALFAALAGSLLAVVTTQVIQRRQGVSAEMSRRTKKVSLAVVAILIVTSFVTILRGWTLASAIAVALAAIVTVPTVFARTKPDHDPERYPPRA